MSIQLPTDLKTAAAPARNRATPTPPVVYLLADHLDAVLARGEDLLASSWRPDRTARCPETIASHQAMQRDVIRTIRTHELLLVSRALKARERARELAILDRRFAPLARVFAAATSSLEDAAREAGDLSAEQFDTGVGILAYMRGRGMVAQDSAALDDCGAIVVSPKFLVARRIELEIILDLVATFLDTMELHFDIYPDVDGTPVDESSKETADHSEGFQSATDLGDRPVATTDASPRTTAASTTGLASNPSSSLIERLSSAPQP